MFKTSLFVGSIVLIPKCRTSITAVSMHTHLKFYPLRIVGLATVLQLDSTVLWVSFLLSSQPMRMWAFTNYPFSECSLTKRFSRPTLPYQFISALLSMPSWHLWPQYFHSSRLAHGVLDNPPRTKLSAFSGSKSMELIWRQHKHRNKISVSRIYEYMTILFLLASQSI